MEDRRSKYSKKFLLHKTIFVNEFYFDCRIKCSSGTNRKKKEF